MGERADSEREPLERLTITVSGVVQGVGFRPFVHGLAQHLGLRGFVKNVSGDVLIDVEGTRDALAEFMTELSLHPPPLARIDDIRTTVPSGEVRGETRATGDRGNFLIEVSQVDADIASTRDVVLPPDVATCDDCLRELFDPKDSRYRYPFLNCTNCGPRLTIVRGAPYDRERTVMARFPMCESCRAEYEDPRDRRFHAQPIACAACGPQLEIKDATGKLVDCPDPLALAIAELARGSIICIKGLGGYHLACDAENEEAVTDLRRRKHRDDKPFAVMVPDADVAERLCDLSVDDREILESPARPIVILRRRREQGLETPGIAPGVTPDSGGTLGLLLPYTPVHHLVLREGGFRALVMTSANRSDEPMVYLDDDAIARMNEVADFFLCHDRPIETRCDDSVLRSTGTNGEPAIFLRRSRGYAPSPFKLLSSVRCPTLAVGGDLKSSFALATGDRVVVSHHLGDLEHYAAYQAYDVAVRHYQRVYRVTPRLIVHDLHPDYASTRYAIDRARRTGVDILAVQHHHAHMASCMVEQGLVGPAIGVCFDGAGLGTDGTIWGGEFLVGDYRAVTRAAHLRPVPLPGGDVASREPWRMAVAHLVAAGEDCANSPVARRVGPPHIKGVVTMIGRRLNAPLTSSIGRLFDAVASLSGVCDRTTFEGQAAMRLESLAATATSGARGYAFDWNEEAATLEPAAVIRQVVRDVERRVDAATIARRFHTALVDAVVSTCQRIRSRTGLSVVVLSGGVFSNAILSVEVAARLRDGGFVVGRHRLVPPNDGGLCLGQMAIAAAARGEV